MRHQAKRKFYQHSFGNRPHCREQEQVVLTCFYTQYSVWVHRLIILLGIPFKEFLRAEMWTGPSLYPLGDSHKGYRVIGTNQDYFKYFSYGNKRSLIFF